MRKKKIRDQIYAEQREIVDERRRKLAEENWKKRRQDAKEKKKKARFNWGRIGDSLRAGAFKTVVEDEEAEDCDICNQNLPPECPECPEQASSGPFFKSES